MVRMPVREERRVDALHLCPPQQLRQRGVAEVHDELEAVVLDQVAGARLPGGGPGAAAAEHRDPHGPAW